MKMHILQHLSEFVERSGPLWTSFSLFFENLNGVLKKFVHGTRFVFNQVRTIGI